MLDSQDVAWFQGLLYQCGIKTKYDGTRLDANEAAFIATQLQYAQARSYDTEYPPSKGRLLVPVKTDVPAGAEFYTSDSWDTVGLAEVIGDYADNLPTADAFLKREQLPLRGLGNSYIYSIQDIRAIQQSRSSFDTKKILAVRRAIEFKIDKLIAVGDEKYGLYGLVNNPSVPLVSPAVGDWDNTTTADEMLDDLNKLVNSIVTATYGRYAPDTVAVDEGSFALMARHNTTLGSSVLRTFLDTNQYIKNVEQWSEFNTADDDGTGPRIMAYARSPDVVEYVIAQEFEQLPPQPRNLAFVVPCHARVGSVSFHYPLAAAYMDLTVS